MRDLMRQVRGRRFRRDRVHQPFAALLVGQSGVGKTETAVTLGERLFPGVRPIVYHMEAFAQEHQATDLIGAPASFVGFDQGSRLVNDVRGRPRVALIFDEIEKAHPRVAQVLMGILDRGEYTDPRGLRGDFRHAYFFFTSNVVSDPAAAALERGEYEALVRREFAARGFPPEQVARFGRPICFDPLDPPARERVAEIALEAFAREYLDGYGVPVHWDEAVPRSLANLAGDPALGVRPILRYLQDLRAVAVDALFDGPLPSALVIEVDVTGELRVRRVD